MPECRQYEKLENQDQDEMPSKARAQPLGQAMHGFRCGHGLLVQNRLVGVGALPKQALPWRFVLAWDAVDGGDSPEYLDEREVTKCRATVCRHPLGGGATIGHFPARLNTPIVRRQVFRIRTPLDSKPRLRGFFFGYAGTLISSLTQITQVRLIHLRWLSVLAMFLAALISPNILGASALMPRLLAFATLIAALNACMQLALILTRTRGVGLPIFSPLIQLVFDLAAWGAYIYLSGGATNPLISVFLPLVAIAAIVLGKRQSWFFGFAAIFSYTFLWRFYQPLEIADAQTATRLHLLGMWLVFVVSAVVVIWFILQMTQAIRERDKALAEAREQFIRNDWVVSMGSLAAGAAHELSTPLGTMNILVDEWLEDANLPASKRREYALLRKQIEICKHSLNLLTQRAGSPRIVGVDGVPAEQWLHTLLSEWTSSNPGASLIVSTDWGTEVPRIPADINLERAVANLLDNAMAAGACRIALEARCSRQNLVIQIDDDGRGISSNALHAFNRAQPIASDQGMGIGLLLSRSAAERQGGRLILEKLLGRGTRATLKLPIDNVSEETAYG